MTFKSGAGGVEKKGKTVGKNYGNSGPTAKMQNGGKKTAGVTSAAMKAVGRNMARANNQRGR
jgi:hypothetical protein